MNRRALGLLMCSLLQWQAEAATTQSGTDVANGNLSLHFAGGRLSAQIENAPLGAVLAALEREVGMTVRFMDPAVSALPVWVSFKDTPLDAGIRSIMSDASYVYYASAKTRVVYVLSSGASRQFLAQSGAAGSSSTAAFIVAQAPGLPDVSNDDAVATGVAEAASKLLSGNSSERMVAAGQLAGIQDGRAVDALVSVASAAGDVDVRVMAVSALSQNALQTPREETASSNALRRLLQDDNPHVRAAAQATLKDLEQQREEIVRAEAARGSVDISSDSSASGA